MNGVILYVTESEDELFPDITIENPSEITEKHTVHLNNAWKITSEVGTTDFEEGSKNIAEIHLLTCISENINY